MFQALTFVHYLFSKPPFLDLEKFLSTDALHSPQNTSFIYNIPFSLILHKFDSEPFGYHKIVPTVILKKAF